MSGSKCNMSILSEDRYRVISVAVEVHNVLLRDTMLIDNVQNANSRLGTWVVYLIVVFHASNVERNPP